MDSDRSTEKTKIVIKKQMMVIALAMLVFFTFSATAQRNGNKDRDELANTQTTFSSDKFSALQWRNLGPFRGGRSVAASGVVGDPQTYYFGSVGGGIWKTSDAGLNWNNVSDGFLASGSVASPK